MANHQIYSKCNDGLIISSVWLCMLTILAFYTSTAFAAKAHAEKCYKLGDSVTVTVNKSKVYGGSFDLISTLCVKDPKTGKPSTINSVELDGGNIPHDVDMVVSGTLKDAFPVYGYSITIESVRDVNEDAKTAYKASHGADDYNTCLQWQKDAGHNLNRKTNGGDVKPVFTPECGISAANSSPPHTVTADWMPYPGEGTLRAKKIIDNAIAQGANLDSDKRFDACTNWQGFVRTELEKNHYPAYQNTMEYFPRPNNISPSERCGISLSNNDSHEMVYLWMPENLEYVEPSDDPNKICSRSKRDSYGQLILAKTPCVLHDMSQVNGGIATTSIYSDPRGAALIMDGVVITHAPAILILDQLGNRSNVYTINIKMEGYEEGSINVKSGDVLMVPLTPKSAGH